MKPHSKLVPAVGGLLALVEPRWDSSWDWLDLSTWTRWPLPHAH